MLLHKFSPKLLGSINSDILEHLVPEKALLVLESLIYIDLSQFLYILLILFNQVLFDLDLAPKYNKLVVNGRVAQLAFH